MAGARNTILLSSHRKPENRREQASGLGSPGPARGAAGGCGRGDPRTRGSAGSRGRAPGAGGALLVAKATARAANRRASAATCSRSGRGGAAGWRTARRPAGHPACPRRAPQRSAMDKPVLCALGPRGAHAPPGRAAHARPRGARAPRGSRGGLRVWDATSAPGACKRFQQLVGRKLPGFEFCRLFPQVGVVVGHVPGHPQNTKARVRSYRSPFSSTRFSLFFWLR